MSTPEEVLISCDMMWSRGAARACTAILTTSTPCMYAYSRIYIHIPQANADYNNSQNKRPSTAKPHANGDSSGSGSAAASHHVAPARPHQQHIHLQQQATGNAMQPQARAAMPLAGIASAVALASTATGSIPVVAGSITKPAGGLPGMRMAPAPGGNGMDWVFC
jgi:hypothetical protein